MYHYLHAFKVLSELNLGIHLNYLSWWQKMVEAKGLQIIHLFLISIVKNNLIFFFFKIVFIQYNFKQRLYHNNVE